MGAVEVKAWREGGDRGRRTWQFLSLFKSASVPYLSVGWCSGSFALCRPRWRPPGTLMGRSRRPQPPVKVWQAYKAPNPFPSSRRWLRIASVLNTQFSNCFGGKEGGVLSTVLWPCVPRGARRRPLGSLPGRWPCMLGSLATVPKGCACLRGIWYTSFCGMGVGAPWAAVEHIFSCQGNQGQGGTACTRSKIEQEGLSQEK